MRCECGSEEFVQCKTLDKTLYLCRGCTKEYENNTNNSDVNLHSTVNSMGKYETHVFHFEGNEILTYNGLMPETLKEGYFTKIKTKDGRMLMINKRKLLLVEIFPEDHS